MIYDLDEDSVIKFCGAQYTVEQFRDKYYPDTTIAETLSAWQVLLRKGDAKLILNKSKEQKKLERIVKEESFRAEAQEHEHFEEQHADFRAMQKREGRAIYEKVEFDFPNLLKAQEFQYNMTESLRIKNSEIVLRPGIVVCVFYKVTDSDINHMSRMYKADKFVSGTVNYAQKGAQSAADAVHYAATKIVAPTLQIGAKAGVNIMKTLVTTIAKTGGSFITAAAQGAKETSRQIRYDPDVLKAGKELIETKDAITRKVVGMTGGLGGGNGIRVSQQ